ncbi:hybrid sensor histidine kinase/response regulator [Aliiruegeria lutimaris]|uniref:histidine kinase n=1 Tax=Aliiruegeria lutimaris TaxID=571298 RepID=A0A1G9N032_9RHOB|nr:PAS domain-containing sensor histidine kinase [Aliiruegeria lutimaris]SDL79753.1 PAS/PAC sensor hybrid histidine kinase [Aliiruegeria lutimaris]
MTENDKDAAIAALADETDPSAAGASDSQASPARVADRLADDSEAGLAKLRGLIRDYQKSALEMQARAHAAQSYADSIFNAIREPMLVLNGTLCIESVNHAFRQMFLADDHDVSGMSLFEICDGGWDLPELRHLLGQVLPDSVPVEGYAFSINTRDSDRREFALHAGRMSDEASGTERILLTLDDLTERDRTRNAVQGRERRLNAIVRAIPEAVVSIDVQGTILTFNPAAEEIFGYKAEEIIGDTARKLMPFPMSQMNDDQFADYIRNIMLDEIGEGLDAEARRKDDEWVPVHIQASPVTLKDQQQYICILRDLTGERSRRVLLERAQKMEAVGQLTCGVVHDFNNLLTVVIGNLELHEMRNAGGENEGLLSEALEAANLGAALTKKLLAFSKKQPLAPKILALPELIEGLHPLLSRALGEPIRIKTFLSEDLDTVLADPGQIESAVLNMAINARDAMPDGGTVTIKARNRTIKRGASSGKFDLSPGQYVELSVIDTGSGMSPEVREHAFDPFFSTKDYGTRSGLGLSMVYGFAKQSGGTVTLTSKVGKGSRISLFLPSALGGTSAPAVEKRGLIASVAAETVLLVEDDTRVRHLTRGRLEFLGYKVIEAADGPAALRALNRRRPIDLILSDVVMPGGMTGVDLAEKVGELYPDIRILLASGYVRDAVEKAKRPDGRTYTMLRKPYGLVKLSQALRDLLQ